MARSLCRHCITWRSVRMMIVVATLTMMGLLTVQNNQCTLLTDGQDGNTVSNVERQSEHVPGFSVEDETFYWADFLTTLNITNMTMNKYLRLSSNLQTQNLSKVGQDWFRILPNERYLENHTHFFTKGSENKTTFSDTFLITPDNICAGNAPFILVIIPSVASSALQRDAIRSTWLAAAETSSWPRAFIKEKIKHIFLFGVREGKQADDYKELTEESQIFGDIVLGDFADTYRNLSRKVLTGLVWARQYCKNARFVLKSDEDTFINMPLMIEVLRHVDRKNKNESFIVGLQHSYNQPEVVRGGRWGVTKEEYPLDFYPKYLYGHTYVLNNKALLDIIDIAHFVTLIAPEDAFITGILPRFAGVLRISAPSFTVCCRDIFDCEVVWNQRVALPEIKSDTLLFQLWANIMTQNCSIDAKFIH